MTNTQSLYQTLTVGLFLTKNSDQKNNKHTKIVLNLDCLFKFYQKFGPEK